MRVRAPLSVPPAAAATARGAKRGYAALVSVCPLLHCRRQMAFYKSCCPCGETSDKRHVEVAQCAARQRGLFAQQANDADARFIRGRARFA